MRQALVYPGENGYWVAECPSLPGCVSQGTTREEAIANIREAIDGYINVLKENGLPIPEENLMSWFSGPESSAGLQLSHLLAG